MQRGQIPDPGGAGLGTGARPGGNGALTVEPTWEKHQEQAAQELKEDQSSAFSQMHHWSKHSPERGGAEGSHQR